jgi:hypothetical protein
LPEKELKENLLGSFSLLFRDIYGAGSRKKREHAETPDFLSLTMAVLQHL